MARKPNLTSNDAPSAAFVRGPWFHASRGGSQTFIYGPDDRSEAIALVYGTNPRTRKRDPNYLGNARRIVACVNACQGIASDALEAHALDKARAAMREALSWLQDNDEGQTGVAMRLADAIRELGGDLDRQHAGEYFAIPQAAGEYAKLKLAGHEREVFAVMFMDARNRLIMYEEMFADTVNGAVFHPREVVKQALKCNAAAVIVAHNHPTWDPTPSAADREINARLKEALKLVDVRLLDHFVVGEGQPVSMAVLGYL